MNPLLGDYHELALWSESRCERPLSFLDNRWKEVAVWKAAARARLDEFLAYEPPACELAPRVLSVRENGGIVTELVSWAQPFGPRTEAYVVRPAGRAEKLPGVVALHDHSDFKYFGKEKLVACGEEPRVLAELKREIYAGRSWANELAARGYVVLVPDSFLWGSRRVSPESVPESDARGVLKEAPGSPAYIDAYNSFAAGYETIIAKTLFLAGATWTGIMAWEDRRAVDYLVTRADVDASRIGCGGLSGGGLRTIYLAALDDRVRCAVCSGFMSTAREMLTGVARKHTWMSQVPHLSALMDLPDIASLHGPLPLMVQCDRDDPLWTLAGQEQACARIAEVYAKMGARESFRGAFYPGPHKFDLPMQRDAFDWFDASLGAPWPRSIGR
jgi:dienelactone hydrolase